MNSYIIFLIIEGAFALLSAMTWSTTSLYHATVAELSPLQLVLVGTVLEATAFVSEVPTGVIADVYSRRLSVIISTFMVGIGHMIQVAFPIFGVIVLAQVIEGVGWTFRSGAVQAWLIDEIGEAQASRTLIRAGQLNAITTLLGLVIGAAAGNFFGVRLPILLGGAVWCGLGIFLIFAMKEHNFSPQTDRDRPTLQTFWQTLLGGVQVIRARRIVLISVSIYLLAAFGGEGFYRLWVLHTVTNIVLPDIGALQPVVWTSVMEGGGMLLAIGVMEIVRRHINMDDNRAVSIALFTGIALTMVSTYAFAFTSSYVLGALAFWVQGGISRCLESILQAWSSLNIAEGDSKFRATVFSAFGFADGLGSAVGGPIIGAVGNRSLRVAFALSATLSAPILFLSMQGRRQATKPK